MPQSKYVVNRYGSGNKRLFSGMFLVDYVNPHEVKDYSSYPIKIDFVYCGVNYSASETVIILNRNIFFESYRRLKENNGEKIKLSGSYAGKIRANLEELLSKGRISKEIKEEIRSAFHLAKLKNYASKYFKKLNMLNL